MYSLFTLILMYDRNLVIGILFKINFKFLPSKRKMLVFFNSIMQSYNWCMMVLLKKNICAFPKQPVCFYPIASVIILTTYYLLKLVAKKADLSLLLTSRKYMKPHGCSSSHTQDSGFSAILLIDYIWLSRDRGCFERDKYNLAMNWYNMPTTCTGATFWQIETVTNKMHKRSSLSWVEMSCSHSKPRDKEENKWETSACFSGDRRWRAMKPEKMPCWEPAGRHIKLYTYKSNHINSFVIKILLQSMNVASLKFQKL